MVSYAFFFYIHTLNDQSHIYIYTHTHLRDLWICGWCYQNKMLEFARLLKAEEQTVAGTMHHLTLEAVDAGKKMIYEAKVWVKPWLNFKELQDFKHTGESEAKAEDEAEAKITAPSFTSSDLGVKKGSSLAFLWIHNIKFNQIIVETIQC